MRERLIVADAVRTATGVAGDAVLVHDGVVSAIGSAADLRRPGILEERYPSAVIMPGLVDAHFHPLGYTAALLRLTLDEAHSMEELLELVAGAAASLPPERSLVGTRLDDHPIGRLPTRLDLDRVVPERPVLLYRYCGHVAVANTAALDLAGISEATPDPEGGTIDRDALGVPTGVLRETAIAPVAGPVGGRVGDLTAADVLIAMRGLASLGLTGMGAIIDLGGDLWCGIGNELDLITEVAPDLPLRMSVLVHTGDPATLERAAGRLSNAGPWVRFLGVKQFADGSLGGHTAALHDPYQDAPATSGVMRIGPTTGAMARASLALGGRVAVHAIGDRANGAVIDLFEELAGTGADPGSLRLEHASVVSPADVERLAAVGATAVVQPAFLMSERQWLERRVGPDRIHHTYAFRSLLRAGVPLAGSSDCPVEPPSPWWGMAAARDRAGLTPDERLTGEEAFHLFTAGAARAIGAPTLEPGAPCDLTIAGVDPVTAAPDALREAQVLATWVEGEPVAVPSRPRVWATGF